ncbi:MAG TPA: carboxypeptidase-like regulatory domain-containing protein [Chitinophagaceae bacterium]|nr:carboxypeptidase-like regulatory domain-containing protein [Chitinophagaceae bacterium]
MKRLLLFFVLLLTIAEANAQQITGQIVDASTNKPLSYATIIFNHQHNIQYTDSSGRFTLPKDSLRAGDSIYIDFLGYKRLAIAVEKLTADNFFRLGQQSQELTPVIVANCRQYRNIDVNKRVGRIVEYFGPGPETKFIIIGRYADRNEVTDGYIKTLEIYAGRFNQSVHVPVRIHWYEWDSARGLPGNELTTGNIIVYPYRKGWNKFSLPYNSIYFDHSIVLGIEFIYPVEYMNQYNALPSVDDKAQWLMDMSNRWSLGIQTTKYEDEGGFYLINNLPIQKYNSRGRNLYIKPAVRFTVEQCVE